MTCCFQRCLGTPLLRAWYSPAELRQRGSQAERGSEASTSRLSWTGRGNGVKVSQDHSRECTNHVQDGHCVRVLRTLGPGGSSTEEESRVQLLELGHAVRAHEQKMS